MISAWGNLTVVIRVVVLTGTLGHSGYKPPAEEFDEDDDSCDCPCQRPDCVCNDDQVSDRMTLPSRLRLSLYVPKTATQVETSSFPDVEVGITYCHSVWATSHLKPLDHKRWDLQLYVLNRVDKGNFHGTGYQQETWGCPAMTKLAKLGYRTRCPQPCIQRVQDLQLHCWTTLRKRSYTFVEHSHKPWLSIGTYLHLGRNTKGRQAKNVRRHV